MDFESYRKSRGLSLSATASALGLQSKTYVSDIEKRRRPPSLRVAIRIQAWSAGVVTARELLPDDAEAQLVPTGGMTLLPAGADEATA